MLLLFERTGEGYGTGCSTDLLLNTQARNHGLFLETAKIEFQSIKES